MSDPAVSVMMAAYQGERYLRPAIDSVLGQTHGDLELIVVDDASTDATADIVAEYARADPERVRLVRREVREGPCRARNVALDHARAPLICWIDQDDLWLPTKVAEQVEVMRRRPEVGLVYTHYDAFDSDSGVIVPAGDSRREIEGDVLRALFVVGCFIASITAMFRRAALERRHVRLRERDFSIGDDHYLWMTIALDWQVACIPRVLARYRRHAANESARMAGATNVAAWRVGLLREFLDEFPEASARLGRERGTALAWHSLLAMQDDLGRRRLGAALAHGARALRLSPRTVLDSRLGLREPA